MSTQEREDTRPAWDNIAPGYDKAVTSTHMRLGNEGLRRGELTGVPPKAIEQYRKTLEMDPNFVFSSWLLGQANKRKGMYDEAVSVLSKGRVLLA